MANSNRTKKTKRPALTVKQIRTQMGLTLPQLATLATEFARENGEPERDILYQTLQRLESGDIGMSVEWMIILSGAFNRHVGAQKFKPWHLIADPAEVETILQDEEERFLVQKRRSLSEDQQRHFDAMTKTFLESLRTSKK